MLYNLRFKSGDPRRFGDRDLTIVQAVVLGVPSGGVLSIVFNARDEVFVGHVIVKAARKLGIEPLTVIRNDGLTEIEDWLREFEAGLLDFSHIQLGFDNGELDKLLGMPGKIVGKADDVPKFEELVVSKLGMVRRLGQYRVIVGDATGPDHMARLMAGTAGKLALTDSPFGCKIERFVSKGRHRDFVQGAGDMPPEEPEAFFRGFAQNLMTALRKGALAYVFIDWRSLHILLRPANRCSVP